MQKGGQKMYTNPNSYGTGRDPQQKNGHTIPILLLLLCCVTIHGLTLLYLNNKDHKPYPKETAIPLEELPTEELAEKTVVPDNFGLGLELSDMDEIEQRYWSLPDGIFVEQIQTDGTAYEAGVRMGDVLLEIEEQPVDDVEDFLEALETFEEESHLELVFYREGQEHSVTIPLTEKNGE
jgi:hypothetical protein